MNAITPRIEAEANDAPFAIDQLFYSRTDKRGVIGAGNSVFQEISGFSWDELVGAPHKIVRNRDTPRAVFRIMWRAIQADEPVVAYVRNRTKDGRGYWVIATVLPLDDGYLSVRIKPTSPLFAQVRTLYAALATAEAVENISVEEGEARLLRGLAEHGFPDYQTFMRHALATEFRLRETAIGTKRLAYFTDVEKIRSHLISNKTNQEDLIQNFDRLRDLPTNMRIIASRLEPSGGPITAISDIYNATSAELFRQISEFAEGKKSLSKLMAASFENAIFIHTCSTLQAEVISQFAKETLNTTSFDPASEAVTLADLGRKYEGLVEKALHGAEDLARALNRASSDLRRAMLGLDTIRVMGRVESGRMGPGGNRIGATIDQLDTCHDGIISLLQKIMDSAAIINAGVSGLRSGIAD